MNVDIYFYIVVETSTTGEAGFTVQRDRTGKDDIR